MGRPSLEEALAAMIATPRRAAKILSDATDGKRGSRKEIEIDARFGAPILAAWRIPAVRKETPWLVQYLGSLRHTPAAQELLAQWRAGGSNSDQIGGALLDIGEPTTLAAMAREVTRANDNTRWDAIHAVLRTKPKHAFAILAPMVRKKHRGAEDVLSVIAKDKKLARDPKWRSLAVDMIRARRNDVVEQAWALLRGNLPPAELAMTLRALGPPDKSPTKAELAAREQRLAKARVDLVPLFARLAKTKGVTRAKPTAAKVLRAIEAIVGALPANVRAYYERFDATKVGGKKGVHLVPLSEILADAKYWAEMWGAPHAPRAFIPAFDVPIAPDGSTRAGYSGGPAYGFSLPTKDDDPRIEGERGNPRFSELLARAVK